jgi:hypothetical protein
VESVKFGIAAAPAQKHELLTQFVAGHPEPALLFYVQLEMDNWLERVTPEESDRYVVLVVLNMAS